jgi:hypothetical protein
VDGYNRRSPGHDPLPWVLIAIALFIAAVIFIKAL